MNHFGAVQTWLLNSYNIKVSSEWLTACLEWITQESEHDMQSGDTVKEQVFEQWLTSDLAEIGEPCLPAAATSSDKFKLISNYPLQIVSIVDVGFPLYGQQLKMTGRENINAEVSAEKPFQPAWEPKQSRMLLITLTDGHSEIKAMELQPIRALHPQLPSGMKCVVMGTIMCRRGMILLTEEHIQLLGGEVDTLTEVNTPLNVLQQAMEKNREDSGKHAKQEFSGKFISRCSDKKLDLKRKPSTFQTENASKKSQQNTRFQGPSQIEEKKDVKLFGKVKEEETKFHSGRINYSSGSGMKHENLEEWEDDINYSELFDNDMEFEDQQGSSHNTCTPIQRMDNSAKTFPASLNASLGDRHSQTIKIENSDMISPRILSKKSTVNTDVFDISDEDMEIENVFDDSEPFWHPKMQKASSNENSPHDSISNPTSTSKKPNHILISETKALTCKQEVSSQNMNNRSLQGSKSVVDFYPPSPTFTSPVSKIIQTSSQSEKKPCLSNNKQAPVKGSSQQSKKPKVQAKLSDLFSKQPKTTVKSEQGDSNKHLNLEDVSVSHPSNERLSSQNSKAMSISSNNEKSSVQKTLSPSLQTSGKTEASNLGPKIDADIKILPKAVIQPFKPASTTEKVCDDTPTYSQLSVIQSSNTGSIKVKVSILTLIERLCSNNGSHWSLACKISDSITTLDVDISNGVLTGLIGFSAEDSIAMRQRFKAEPDVKEVFAEGLSQCQSKLISGRDGCLVELEPACRNTRGKRPIIISFHLDSS